jgi:hypothetical protein
MLGKDALLRWSSLREQEEKERAESRLQNRL